MLHNNSVDDITSFQNPLLIQSSKRVELSIYPVIPLKHHMFQILYHFIKINAQLLITHFRHVLFESLSENGKYFLTSFLSNFVCNSYTSDDTQVCEQMSKMRKLVKWVQNSVINDLMLRKYGKNAQRHFCDLWGCSVLIS